MVESFFKLSLTRFTEEDEELLQKAEKTSPFRYVLTHSGLVSLSRYHLVDMKSFYRQLSMENFYSCDPISVDATFVKWYQLQLLFLSSSESSSRADMVSCLEMFSRQTSFLSRSTRSSTIHYLSSFFYNPATKHWKTGVVTYASCIILYLWICDISYAFWHIIMHFGSIILPKRSQ